MKNDGNRRARPAEKWFSELFAALVMIESTVMQSANLMSDINLIKLQSDEGNVNDFYMESSLHRKSMR